MAISVTAMAEIENFHLGEVVTYYHDMNTHTKNEMSVNFFMIPCLPDTRIKTNLQSVRHNKYYL